MKNNKGQTLYYFLILVVILVISCAMMLNIANLIRNRMIMQNKADNIALSLATYKARVLNFLGGTNYLMGTALSLGMNPRGMQLASYSTDVIGGLPATMTLSENPLSDLKHKTFYTERNSGVKKIKQVVDFLQKIQDMAINGYTAYCLSILKDNISKDYNVVVCSQPKNLGLKRNSKGIQYYSTTNIMCIYLSRNNHLHLLKKKEYEKSDYSWFVEGDGFSEQKIKVILKSKNKTPLFAKLLKINYPTIVVSSAAAPYNTKGSMFPKKEDTLTGATIKTASLVEAASAYQLYLMEKAVSHAYYFGLPGIIMAAAAQAAIAFNYAESKRNTLKLENKDNPIDAYLKSKAGGWAAHLVPCDKP